MRALHLLKTNEGARWALLQVAHLVEDGIAVHVLIPDAHSARAEDYRRVGASVIGLDCDLNPKRPLASLRAMRRLRAIVAETQPDLIHSHFLSTTLAARLAGATAVARIFQVPGPLHLQWEPSRRADILSARRSDFWLASSNFTRTLYHAAGVAEDRVGLAYYGTDTERFLAAGVAGALRNRFQIPPGAFVVGNVGYFYRPRRHVLGGRAIKGHEVLIRAVARLRARGCPAHLVLVGGPWKGAERYVADLSRYAGELLGPAYHYAGATDNVVDCYADFDVAVHPSISDNLGGAVESLLCGIPTIASDAGGLPEAVVPGETGRLFPSGDSEGLADQLEWSYRFPDEARALAVAGRARMLEMLDARTTTRAVRAFYDHCLEHMAPRRTASAGAV
jgi:glycosyltransferase involved in cell wall biosynthesis